MPSPTTSTILVAGKKTQVTIGGEGPPVLYLHSAGGETDWTKFHDLLAAQFQVIVPAHPGFASSAGLDAIRDVVDYAWHYVDLLKVMNLSRVPVIGFSLGAWTGIELAILRPALVEKLILVNSAGLHVAGAPMGELFTDDLEYLRNLLFYDPTSPVVKEAMPLSLDDSRILQWLKAREATARVGWNPYLHNPRLRAHLRRVECPTQVVWGRNDKLIPLAHGEVFSSEIPGAKLTVLDTCGHMLPFEKPEQLCSIASEFFAS